MTRPTAQDALTEEELENLLAQIATTGPAGQRNLALLTLMADTGLRVGEALALTTGDLEKKGGVVTHVQIRNSKTGKKTNQPVTLRGAARLGEWLEARPALGIGNGVVFCTVSKGQRGGFGGEKTLAPGRAISARYVRQLLDRKAQEAGIERHITPHTLRHTFATHLPQSDHHDRGDLQSPARPRRGGGRPGPPGRGGRGPGAVGGGAGPGRSARRSS